MATRFGEILSRPRDKFAYQVFLGFRGEDIRKRFIDHLHHALKRAGISTFHDDSGLERGSDIQLKIYEAIQGSRISIVTFSSHYATSRWCLDELVKIMDRKRSPGHLVLPVFYDVDPSIVRHQSGLYKIAFDKHEVNTDLGPNRVESWRAAMREVADLAGFVLQNQADGHEGQFIQNIIKEVIRILHNGHLSVPRCIVGVDNVVEAISTWLHNGSLDVEVGVIHGLGGIGKTTIAKVVYNSNYDKFEGCSFVADIRTVASQENGIVRILKQIISNLSGDDAREIYNVHEGMLKIKEVIGSRRILLILDDWEQIGSIFDYPEWFYPGSKILVTTRNMQLPINHMPQKDFEVLELNSYEATKLFCWNAFGQYVPLEKYSKVIDRFIRYCGGLPLAVEVLSSSLRGKELGIWESQLAKLEKYPDKRIQDILKLSFYSLADENDKDIFLHIAFFMVGMHKDDAFAILDGCDLYAEIGFQNLVDRCLVTLSMDNHNLMMHQLVQQMGREIVRQEADNRLGQCSRLLGHKDACYVLRNNKGTSYVKGLSFHFPERSGHPSPEDHYVDHTSRRACVPCIIPATSHSATTKFRPIRTDAFTNMDNLNLLELNYVQLQGTYEDFPKALKWLRWKGCPLESIPDELDLFELVVLDMQHSCLKHAWEGSKYLGALKILNLSHSHRLVDTPDFSCATGIKVINLEDCVGLVELHESVGYLSDLTELNLKGCIQLKRLPRSIHKLTSLKKVNLSGCAGIFTVLNHIESPESGSGEKPVDGKNCQALAQFTSLSRSPVVSFQSFSSLVDLNLADCGITQTDILSYLSSCSASLEFLNLSRNPINAINSDFSSFPDLRWLSLSYCKHLQSISALPLGSWIDVIGCDSLERIAFEQRRHMIRETVAARNCPKLVKVENVCKIEKSSDMSASKARYLGFSGLESKNICNDHANWGIQKGVYQYGVYAVFLLGDHIANWFTATTTGWELEYTVPLLPNRSIQGINVCYVFKIFRSSSYDLFFSSLCVGLTKINQSSSDMWKWTYRLPSHSNVYRWFCEWLRSEEEEEENKEMLVTLISHWCVMKHREVRPGDVLNVAPLVRQLNGNLFDEEGLSSCITKCGVNIVYEDSDDENKVNGDHDKTVVDWYDETFRSVDLSMLIDQDSSEGSCLTYYTSDFGRTLFL